MSAVEDAVTGRGALTAMFLLIAVVALGFRARRRRGFGPFFVGLGAAAIVLGGKFGFESDLAM
jgi:MYXO-CTERM domain-containing protein